MNSTGSLSKFEQIIDKVEADIDSVSGAVASVKGIILEQFGPNGLIAAYIAVAALLLLVLWRLTKVTFSTLKYLVLPALVLAVLGSFVLPYSFVVLLPITVTGCSLLLLFKG